jgi:hypothetical protein
MNFTINHELAHDPYTLEVFADYLEEHPYTKQPYLHLFLRARQYEERGYCGGVDPNNGNGVGYGYGDVYGNGDGCGDGHRNGSGYGCGDGFGNGNGYGDGCGWGYADGYGNGYYGYANGY